MYFSFYNSNHTGPYTFYKESDPFVAARDVLLTTIYSAINDDAEAIKLFEARTVHRLDRITYDVTYSTISDDKRQSVRAEIKKLADTWQSRLRVYREAERKRLQVEAEATKNRAAK